MGIFCKIHVEEPENKVFTPGSVVCGHIKYALDKNTVVNSVNVSFIGRGWLEIDEHEGKRTTTYNNSEEYIRIQNIKLNEGPGKTLAIGEYDTTYNFQLPEDIPPTLNYSKTDTDHEIKCKINYIIKIKFVIPGMFKFNKKFVKEITVASYIKPKMVVDPVIYGESKTLFQPFRFKKSIVNVKAYVKNSIIEPGGKVELVYEITNDTNKTINAVEVKILEVYTFKVDEISLVQKCTDVVGTDFKTSSIKSGDTTAEREFEIQLPLELNCLDHSQIVSRHYAMAITVYLPVPHVNMRLMVPMQVGRTSLPKFVPGISSDNNEVLSKLPSYWEAMNEDYEKIQRATRVET